MAYHFTSLSKPIKSSVYSIYWKFAAQRNDIFQRRLRQESPPWTADTVLRENKFTNVFRASDRVSQQLIRIQYEAADQRPENIFFITMLFKLFNKIETYLFLEQTFGELNYSKFEITKFDCELTNRLASGCRIYSAAYIMPSAGSVFQFKFKHSNHLALLERMLADQLPLKIQKCKTLEDVYRLMLSYPSIGPFLAFQFTIDLNYSNLVDFSETDFVVAGPGAVNGIHKCFSSLGDYTYEEVIKWIYDEQQRECEALGINCPDLYGRPMQLIDCQNLFCETDKYLRATHPQLNGTSGRSRIKQKYHTIHAPIAYFFPPKWGINHLIKPLCLKKQKDNIFS